MDPYWKYYDEAYNWDDLDHVPFIQPDLGQTFSSLVAAGASDDYARALISSGYVSVEGYPDLIIDRYYGGLLTSTDGRTRFRPRDLVHPETLFSQVPWIRSANSLEDVRRIVDEVEKRRPDRFLYRGQTCHFPLSRSVPNPHLQIPGLGEPSLIPSVWRRMLQKNTASFASFAPPTLFEWSSMLLRDFDIADIDRRIAAFRDRGELLLTYADMEDCSDTVLAEFGKFSLDLSMGFDFNLADKLATCLQHYGLMSPVLDLTSSLDVALFFATHTMKGVLPYCEYSFVGTNARRSVLYILRRSNNEMTQPNASDEFVLSRCRPLRPIRQHCFVALSAPFALNLPADFLEGVICFDFDLARYVGLVQSDLFPDSREDAFIRALSRMPLANK